MTESSSVFGPGNFGSEPLSVCARALFASALRECSIDRATARSARNMTTGVDLRLCRHVRIVAVGKAAGVMLEAALAHLPLAPGIDLQGVVIAPSRPASLPEAFHFFEGGHPPTERCLLRRGTCCA
jgi:glycerate-2-kinase